jgi:hypothetical protein
MSSQPPHPLNEQEQQYVNQMNPKDRALHELAIQKLGSSYFVKWTHGFKKWSAAVQPIHNTQSPATK